MKLSHKLLLVLALIFIFIFSLSTAFASNTALGHSQIYHATAVHLDDFASDSQKPSVSPLFGSYIGNSNFLVFHYSDCRFVSRMSDYHKVFFGSREDAVNSGYRPCNVCRP